MNKKTEIKQQLNSLIKDYFAQDDHKEAYVKGKDKISLITPSYGADEVVEIIDSLLSTNVTMGEKVHSFEGMFADYIGTRDAVMVNSGSSANLLALSILTNPLLKNPIGRGDEIITPAVTWATTIWPIINCGAVPVLVDVDLDTFDINIDEIEKAITEKTRAIMPVHLLGNPCNMEKIMDIARAHDLYVIEDCCEAHGAEQREKKVGTFGDIGTFSFFFSHHISTIEGGMVVTSNEEIAELSRSLRVFGWIRDLKDRDRISSQYENLDSRYLFINTGYNFRPTDLQGAMGIHQIGKLDEYIRARQENAAFWSNRLSRFENQLLLHRQREDTRHVWFGYPVTVKPESGFTKNELVEFLENKSIETRPIMTGNMDKQPAMRFVEYRKVGDLPNASYITDNSFLFGNHQNVKEDEREAIASYIEEFILSKSST